MRLQTDPTSPATLRPSTGSGIGRGRAQEAPWRARIRRGGRIVQPALISSSCRPFFLLFMPFGAGSILLAIGMAFLEWPLGQPAQVVGVPNFAQVLRDPLFFTGMGNTFRMLVGYLLVLMPLAIFVAVSLMQQGRRTVNLVQLVIFAPITMSLIAVSVIFDLLYDDRVGMHQRHRRDVRARALPVPHQRRPRALVDRRHACLARPGLLRHHVVRRSAVDPGRSLRSCCDRWRRLVAALLVRHPAHAQARHHVRTGRGQRRRVGDIRRAQCAHRRRSRPRHLHRHPLHLR